MVNPQSFLTAICQVTAWECRELDVGDMYRPQEMSVDEIDRKSIEGAYISGLTFKAREDVQSVVGQIQAQGDVLQNAHQRQSPCC